MKKYLAVSVLLFLTVSARAQNLSLYDLLNLAPMNNAGAHNFLSYGKPFKELYYQEINGLTIVHYQPVKPDPKKHEIIIIGDGVKTDEGHFLHTVIYTSSDTKYILKLIGQAKSAGLNIIFRGADANKYIYLLDNFLYSVEIYINNDNNEGSVEVKQKDYMSFDYL